MLLPDSLHDILKQRTWWLQLEPQWQLAFQETVLGHKNAPTDDELQNIGSLTVLRLVGPSAPFPNMTFELTNLSGLSHLTNLEMLFVTHHAIHSLKELEKLDKLTKLFINDNQLSSLKGIEAMINMEQIYCQNNQISSLKPVQNLIKLTELYAHSNELTTLEGLTEEHSDLLKTFLCFPNDKLHQREVIRVENTFGIKCKG